MIFEVNLGKWREHTGERGQTGYIKRDTWETELQRQEKVDMKHLEGLWNEVGPHDH